MYFNDDNKKKYHIKNVTDLCSVGSNIHNIEFRLTEVKSSMRFWWRALNNFKTAAELWSNEKSIFGGNSEIKSPIEFRLLEPWNQFDWHNHQHEVGWDSRNNVKRKIDCISPGQEIGFEMALYKRKISEGEFTNKSIEFYDSLLKLSFILGGLGRRSRRGCGVFYIGDKNKDIISPESIYDDIHSYMVDIGVNCYYDFSNKEALAIQRKDISLDYPYIEEVCISKKVLAAESFYRKIRGAIDNCKNKKIQYKSSDSGRLACPVYVTCYGKEHDKLIPIIVKLHNTSKEANRNYDDSQYYQTFKEEIL